MMSLDDRAELAQLLLGVTEAHVQLAIALSQLMAKHPEDTAMQEQLQRINTAIDAEHTSIEGLLHGRR